MSSIWYQVGKAIRQLVIGARAGEKSRKRHTSPKPSRSRTTVSRSANTIDLGSYDDASPGQLGVGKTRDLSSRELGRVRFEYAPDPDGDPDPGEIVWTWVPYVENDGRGKDRPVLIIGRIDAETVVGCYLSTKQHRNFISIGSGGWDPERRESFLSPERLLRITHEGMRRESVSVDRGHFDAAVAGVLAFHKLR